MALLTQLLQDPRLQEGFQTKAEPLFDDSGERVFFELSSGTWWEKTDKMPSKPKVITTPYYILELDLKCRFSAQGAIALAIVIYTDGTWLSKGGGHKCAPVSVTLGNFPIDIMNKSIAKKASSHQVKFLCDIKR